MGALQEADRRLKNGEGPQAALMMRDAARAARAGIRSCAGSRPSSDAGRRRRPPTRRPLAARRESQGSALGRAESLHGEIESATRGSGYLSGRLGRRVDDAISEEDAGRAALERGDSGEGLKHAEAALAILQDGGGDADNASSAAGGASAMMGGGAPGGAISVRAAPRGSTGMGMERVRLPSADEYRPPRALRDELERSLQEPRPAAGDDAMKEYFKRLTR